MDKTSLRNRRWIVATIPDGLPRHADFRWEEAPLPEIADGEVLLRNHYISIDPGQRVYISGAAGDPLGKPVTAWAVGEVVESRAPAYPVGSFARDTLGQAGVQAYSALAATDLIAVDPSMPLPTYLNTLGMPGLTAYFGILDCARIKAGETVLLSGASGAVAAVAGQIARIKGCRVVGITRGDEKARFLATELGFDAVVDRSSGDLGAGIAQACPEGVDVYFDNVGGPILDACLLHMRPGGRIALCGSVSTYNEGNRPAIHNVFEVMIRGLRMEGFYVGTYADRFTEAIADMQGWIAEGRLRHREHVATGIETFPDVFLDIFRADHLGKVVLAVDPGT